MLSSAEETPELGTALQNVEATTVFALFFGMLMLIFGSSVSLALRRGLSDKLTAFIFMLTTVNFVLFGLQVGAQVGNSVFLLRQVLDQTSSSQAVQLKTTELIIFWCTGLSRLIGDTMIIWRVLPLFYAQKWVVALPLVLLVANLGITFADLGHVSSSQTFENYHHPSDGNDLFHASLILTVCTNVLSALLICFRLWTSRSSVAEMFALSNAGSAMKQFLALLLETGWVYVVLHATFLGINFNENKMDHLTATSSFQDINAAICALLPTVIMLIVQRRRSMADLYGFTAANEGKTKSDARPLSDAGSYELPKLYFTELQSLA